MHLTEFIGTLLLGYCYRNYLELGLALGKTFNIALVINFCLLIIHELFVTNLVSTVIHVFQKYSIGETISYVPWMMSFGFGFTELNSDGSATGL